MYTIHDSRDMGCPVRGFVDDRNPAAAHRSAAALGIPEAHRIILSEPRITVDEARRWALDGRQLQLDLDDDCDERKTCLRWLCRTGDESYGTPFCISLYQGGQQPDGTRFPCERKMAANQS